VSPTVRRSHPDLVPYQPGRTAEPGQSGIRRRPRPSEELDQAPLRGLRAPCSRLRPGGGQAELAGPGSRGLVCYLQSDAPRVNCAEHGPTVAQVPWARHGAGHTRDFDDQVAWLVTHTAKSAVSELLRVAWRTVGSPITRVVGDARAAHDPFDGLTRIGIDEISYKKGTST